MFMLKSLVNTLMPSVAPAPGTNGGTVLVHLPSGQLFSRSPIHKCIFKDAQLSIQTTPAEYQHQLVVSRVYDDDEEPDADDEEDDDEVIVLIDSSIRFQRLSDVKPVRFTWVDPNAEGTVYEFHIDGASINRHTLDFFETTVLECMYERRFQKSRETATHDDLELFRYCNDSAAIDTIMADTTEQMQKLTVQQKQQPHVLGKTLLEVQPVDWYYYNAQSQEFVLQKADVVIRLSQLEQSFDFWLSLSHEGTVITAQPINDQMNPVFSDKHHSFIWLFNDEKQKQIFSFSVVFKDVKSEAEFRQMFGRCIYESNNRDVFSKIDEKDVEYIMQAYNDVEMNDAYQDEQSNFSDSDQENKRDEDEEEEEEETKATNTYRRNQDEADGEKNTSLAVGFKHQRSFVARGDQIGVFKHDENDQLVHSVTINNLRTPGGKTFTPTKMMLHEQDSSIIMMDPNWRDKLLKMDLEHGKIVDEWEVDGDRAVTDFTHDSKYAQMTPQQTFVGVSHNAVFRVDPRQSGRKIVESQTNQYKTKTQFSCAATTGKGDLVVASETGDLRLYNYIEKRAKTHLPGLGDAIIGVDVSDDGRYILATCQKYILVLDSLAETDKGAVSGFTKSMGAKKPAPKRLQLKPEHVAEINMPVAFTTARFNTGDDMEKTIVASTGPFVITWNFRRVKAGKLYDYTIKKYPQHVIADNFRYGSDRNVIVALPDDVQMLSKKEMLTPQKAFASPHRTPAKNLRFRENIVDSPY